MTSEPHWRSPNLPSVSLQANALTPLSSLGVSSKNLLSCFEQSPACKTIACSIMGTSGAARNCEFAGQFSLHFKPIENQHGCLEEKTSEESLHAHPQNRPPHRRRPRAVPFLRRRRADRALFGDTAGCRDHRLSGGLQGPPAGQLDPGRTGGRAGGALFCTGMAARLWATAG